jgi:hypothetical protein
MSVQRIRRGIGPCNPRGMSKTPAAERKYNPVSAPSVQPGKCYLPLLRSEDSRCAVSMGAINTQAHRSPDEEGPGQLEPAAVPCDNRQTDDMPPRR